MLRILCCIIVSLTIGCGDAVLSDITGQQEAESGVDGKDGRDGNDGTNGIDGKDGLNGQDGKDGLNGQDGLDGADGLDGLNGKDGLNGQDGLDGQDGESYQQQVSRMISNIEPLLPSVINIMCNDGVKGWRGTGTLITQGRILTAHHVVDGAVSCSYYSAGVPIGSGGSFRQIGNLDQAIIESPRLNAEGLKLRQASVNYQWIPQLGELLVGATHPGFFYDNPQVSFGTVASTKMSSAELGEFRDYWQTAFTTTDAVMAGGSSGGPIFNQNGEIVGILVGGAVDPSLELAIILNL